MTCFCARTSRIDSVNNDFRQPKEMLIYSKTKFWKILKRTGQRATDKWFERGQSFVNHKRRIF